jgi:hypothetical protein
MPDTVGKNLLASHGESSRVAARRAFYLDDAAAIAAGEIARKLSDGEELVDCLARCRTPEGLTVSERAHFALRLGRHLGLPIARVLPLHSRGMRITYVRQGLSDAAYTALTARLPSPTVRYSDTTGEAVDSVAAGSFDFCILPYADGEGSAVRSVRRLREQAGLRVVSLASIERPESTPLTYALCCRDFLMPSGERQLIELRVPSLSGETLELLLALLRGCSAELLSLESEGSAGRLRVSLSVTRATLIPFLVAFMTLVPSGEIDTLVRYGKK